VIDVCHTKIHLVDVIFFHLCIEFILKFRSDDDILLQLIAESESQKKINFINKLCIFFVHRSPGSLYVKFNRNTWKF
jgi:hypothetical protein